MDIIRLGEYNNVNPTYLPDKIVEGFTSKIWAERYWTFGDFELRTPYIEETMALLPEQTLISHRHTQEVMQVEDLKIVEDQYGADELIITGRTVDSILDDRFVESSYKKRRQMARQYAPVGAALVLMWNVLDNDRTPDPKDVTRWRKDDDDKAPKDYDHDGEPWDWNTKDKLPNVAVSDSVIVNTGDVRRWWLEEGLVYPQLVKILKQGQIGIRTIRPPSGVIVMGSGSLMGERIWVRSTPLDQFGEIVRVTKDLGFTELRFDLYRGLDRTKGNTQGNPAVVFNYRLGDFENTEHLYSVKEWKTALEVMSGLNRKWDIYRNDSQKAFTGWQRRVGAIDAGEPEIPDEPKRPKRKNYNSDSAYNTAVENWENKHDRWEARKAKNIDEFEDDYKKDGRKELEDTRKVTIFSGTVRREGETLYTYKKDYWLGDLVTLRGRKNVLEKARVTEYVLTEDAEGERGYPGLELIDE